MNSCNHYILLPDIDRSHLYLHWNRTPTNEFEFEMIFKDESEKYRNRNFAKKYAIILRNMRLC